MMQTQSDYANVNGGKIYYDMAGAGDVLVLCHAGFVDSRMWDSQRDAFDQHYRVLRYDMRGYGKSDPIDTPTAQRDDLLALLQHLGIERAHFMGCSTGGEIILDIALERPDMVQSLILVSAVPGGFEMQGEPPQEIIEMIQAAQAGNLERVAELQIRLWVDGPYRQAHQVDAAVRQPAVAMNRIPVMSGTWAKLSEPVNPLQPPAAQRLNDIHAPTLVIAGALDNAEIVRAAEVMQSAIAGAQKHIIGQGAHVPNMDQPAEFNRVVLDFLNAVK